MNSKENKRAEFSPITKEIIAKRAGYRCSFPDCFKILVGPGVYNDEVIIIGECAHIFSAVKKGPRTDGGLTESNLKRPENGIYLCRNHHKIVDSKSKDNKYTSDLLIRYKNRHEFIISSEIGEYLYPLNWINSVLIKESSIFDNPIELQLGKVTHFYGPNGSGKSIIIELLYSLFNQKIHPRLNKPNIEFKADIGMDNPVMKKFTGIIKDKLLLFQLQKKTQPFVPYEFLVIYLKEALSVNADDITTIAKCLGMGRDFIKTILSTCDQIDGVYAKSIKMIDRRTSPYPVTEISVDFGNGFLHSFKSFSYTEQASVVLDIASIIATEKAKHKSVLFLIDWESILHFDDNKIQPYFDYLLSSKAHFQSIFVSPNPNHNIEWNGWTIAKFKNHTPNTKLIQNEL